MKALILTHPLGTNYGGILQCYALQTILKQMGYKVEIINLQPQVYGCKRIIHKVFNILCISKYRNFKYTQLYKFVNKHFVHTHCFFEAKQINNYIKKNNINLVVVGSDQVWKSEFATKYGYAYFLDFVPNNVFKLAYAVSFGTNQWKYDKTQTLNISKYIKLLDGFSVRESDAVQMCKNNVGVTPIHVLDPTLILTADDYIKIISPRKNNKKYIFVYWLWNREKINQAVEDIKNKVDYEIIELSMLDGKDFIPVEDWLSYIKYAEMIITDSFHGCAFSIIFNKPVNYVVSDIIFDNRRASLFNMLNINSENISNFKSEEEYVRINGILNKYREKSRKFIINSLKLQ